MRSTDEQVFEHALRFRAAIDRTDKSKLPITFKNFPNGSCGDAALLIGAYFVNVGLGQFQYILGERERGDSRSWSSHAWIENDGLIVDITADQFPDAPRAVMVERNSQWHDQFNGTRQNIAHFNIYDSNTASNLGNAYGEIVRHLCNAT